MHRFVFALVTALVLVMIPTPAAAQEAGKVGVTMGYPGSVGIVWHATEKLALRPDLTFGWSSTEDDDSDIDRTSFSTGLSALFYLRKWDNLATYVSPRYGYSRTSSSFDGPFIVDEASASTHVISGAFGAQYWLGERFSAFGELGLAYSRSGLDDNDERTAYSVNSQSSVGIVFYF